MQGAYPRSSDHEPVGGYTTQSVMQSNARLTVIFPAAQHYHCSLAGTHFLSSWGDKRVGSTHVQFTFMAVHAAWFELVSQSR